jgi:spheroidene monooxygenase
VVVVVLFDFLPSHRSWAWLKLMQGTSGFFKSIPGLLFAKVMGSGENGGFSLRPSATHQGLIFVFDGLKNASAYLKGPDLKPYKEKAKDWWQGLLGVNSCRGSWNHQTWQTNNVWARDFSASVDAPVASLTRGSIRATKATSFWRYAPAAQKDLSQANGCELAIGLGEAPVFRQCTFSLWENTASMVNYAHHGAHQKAISAAKKHNFFSESMFVRMNVLYMQGLWLGKAYHLSTNVAEPYGLSA